MKPYVVAISGALAVVAVAGVGHQLTKPKVLEAGGIKHSFVPLTALERQNVLNIYHANVTPSAFTPNPNATLLTPQSPYYAPLDASLNALGTFQTANGWNRIILRQDNNIITVVIGKPDPTKTYLVTFNLVPSKSIQVFMLTGRTTPVNGTSYDQFQPNATINKATPVPVVVMPGSNTAEINTAVGDRTEYTTCEGVTIEQL